jgi:CheY-like chemotaxis protein/DNA-binding XRE family transcriptional regulator
LGFSQEELAERAGLHRTYIAGIEGGGRNITLKSVQKLARALETSVATLLGELDHSHVGNIPGLLLVEHDAEDLGRTLEELRRVRLTNVIHVAHDGEEALDLLFGRGKYAERRVEAAPQLVLMDLELPKIHGLEVLRRIKAAKQTRMIQVVVLTESRKDDGCCEALRLGAANCLSKPLDFESFCRLTHELSFHWTLFHPPGVQ